MPTKLLTDVLAKSALQVRYKGINRSSNGRTVPYAEEYRASSAQRETPVEHLQKIADQEKGSTPT